MMVMTRRICRAQTMKRPTNSTNVRFFFVVTVCVCSTYNNAGNQLVSVGGEGPTGGAVEGAKTRVVRWDWQAGTIEAQSAGCV